MRHIFAYFILIATAACAPTTDQLFAHANQTGDFTSVNNHFAKEERKLASPNACPGGGTLYCEVRLEHEDCSCTMLPERTQPNGITRHRGPRHRH
jgi:hypothetical protein